jgi:DNA-binding MarR family transcriptional regulator
MDKMELSPADRLVMAAIRLTRTLQWLGRGGPLTSPEIGALVVIVYAGRILARDLAAQQQVTAATMSRLLGNLEERGLIGRKPDKEDSRKQWIKATPSGAALVAREHKRRLAPLEEIVGKLSLREQKALTEASELIEVLTHALAETARR